MLIVVVAVLCVLGLLYLCLHHRYAKMQAIRQSRERTPVARPATYPPGAPFPPPAEANADADKGKAQPNLQGVVVTQPDGCASIAYKLDADAIKELQGRLPPAVAPPLWAQHDPSRADDAQGPRLWSVEIQHQQPDEQQPQRGAGSVV